MKRSMLSKDLQKFVEFILEYRKIGIESKIEEKAVNFLITPDSLQNVKDVSFY